MPSSLVISMLGLFIIELLLFMIMASLDHGYFFNSPFNHFTVEVMRLVLKHVLPECRCHGKLCDTVSLTSSADTVWYSTIATLIVSLVSGSVFAMLRTVAFFRWLNMWCVEWVIIIWSDSILILILMKLFYMAGAEWYWPW